MEISKIKLSKSGQLDDLINFSNVDEEKRKEKKEERGEEESGKSPNPS